MSEDKSYARALSAPTGELVVIDAGLVQQAVEYSRSSPRLRVIQPFHKVAADPLHRMLNAVQPGSYVRPHRHLDPPKSEAWIVLRGRLVFFTFDALGTVTESLELAADSERFGVDLSPGVFHTFIATAPDTVIFECKNGPYVESTDKAFAEWAPAEGAPDCAAYMQRLLEQHRASLR
jgi:cupin fold WbuC family metalloprotein